MKSGESFQKVAPHPTLSRYYEDDARRARYVRDLFDSSARHYEWVNKLFSFGTGQWYREEALRRAGLTEGMHLLDVATGTGGVARAARRIVGSSGSVTGLDPSIGMLFESTLRSDSPAVQGFGELLPFKNETFDFLSMGYAMRHLPDLVAGFRKYHRVLKPGGRVLVLEITPPENRAGFFFMKLLMGHIAPAVVRVGSGSRKAAEMMKYYWETTAKCVPPETILAAMQEAGFSEARRDLRYGTFSDYSAVRL
jgi:demethylmenaquinone methyltransferase / 2-methoxy-6-polyprenyl-1,4-benzoquinol methylase